ncbi:MAG: SCO family protein [Pseudomonadota bacterium]
MIRQVLVAASVSLLTVVSSFGHDGVVHKDLDEALRHQQETSPNTAGFPDVKGGDFELLDHDGNIRTSKSPEGRFQLVFFGYANCKAICSIALPRMAEAVVSLENEGILVTPVLITVDPERDTVDNMKDALALHHERMVGLTGSEEALQVAYDAFQVEKALVYEHPEYGPVYSHGSFIYLLGPNGEFKTLLPPILGPDRMSEVTKSYISGEQS